MRSALASQLVRIDVDGAVDPADENDAATETVAELRRQGEAVLVVDRVLVGSVEHRLVMGWCLPRSPTLPTFPTAQPPRPTQLSECLAPKLPIPHRSTHGATVCLEQRDRLSVNACPASAPAPQRAAKSSASRPSRPAASANARPAAKQSPAPYASVGFGGSGAALYGPPAAPSHRAPGGRHDESRIGIESSGLVALGVVFPTRDQRVELHRPV